MQAVLDPLAMPLATDIVSGERADDPLYIPCMGIRLTRDSSNTTIVTQNVQKVRSWQH
jgi:hypothetical protein